MAASHRLSSASSEGPSSLGGPGGGPIGSLPSGSHLIRGNLASGSGRNLVSHGSGTYVRRMPPRQEALESFLATLRNRGTFDIEQPGFIDSIKEHFEQLPSRYATNVNTNSLDVLNHKRLLDSARSDPSAVSFQVRPVDVVGPGAGNRKASYGSFGSSQANSYQQRSLGEIGSYKSLPRPAFGSSPNLQALVLDAEDRQDPSLESGMYNFYEVTIASVDQAKLLSRLSESLSDIGLNICEAHAFNTRDKFVLDVFVVNGWQDEGVCGLWNEDDMKRPDFWVLFSFLLLNLFSLGRCASSTNSFFVPSLCVQGAESLEEVLSTRLQELPPPGTYSGPRSSSFSSPIKDHLGYMDPELRIPKEELEEMKRSTSGSHGDDWEIDPTDIVFNDKIASGAFGDLFRGSYCGQDVAIKVLRGIHDNSAQFQEFLQEVAIMRKVRHRNVVQFIGACTKKPHLCIVFEYMRGGSVYDHLRMGGSLPISFILRVALEVCRGMDYLHKRKIVHRDLKAANLLLDEHGTVKIADFGVARVVEGPGVMTAETGTYRWMAPEVIEHKPYGQKADVFSFGVVVWELLTGEVPYSDMTPLQAAVGVVQQGLRPPIPARCPAALSDVIRLCWQRDPSVRPSFEVLKEKFEVMFEKYKDDSSIETPQKKGLLGRFKGGSAKKK